MKSHDFLHLYKQRSNPIKITKDTSENARDVKETELNVMEPESKNGESNHSSSEATSGPSPTTVDSKAQLCELERRRALLSSCSEAGDPVSSSGAGFFNGGWRSQLCHCDGCRQLYSRSGVEFLLEESDPVAVYEGKAERRPSTLDAGMAALGSSLDRVQQVEAFHRKLASCLENYDPLTAMRNKQPRGTLMLLSCCRVQ